MPWISVLNRTGLLDLTKIYLNGWKEKGEMERKGSKRFLPRDAMHPRY